jgi:hypothetical protein
VILPLEGILLLARVNTHKRPDVAACEQRLCDEPVSFSAFERWVEDGHEKADWSTFPWILPDEDSDSESLDSQNK